MGAEKKITRAQLAEIADLSGSRLVEEYAGYGSPSYGHARLISWDAARVGAAARKVLGEDLAFHLAGCVQRDGETLYFPGWELQ